MTDETRSGRGLGRYVPRRAAEWDLDAPGRRWQEVEASLCFVDISGFTPLSERLARRGRIGAEELTELLNRVFGRMLGAGLRARRRPAEVRGRRAPAAVREPGPRRAGRQRRGRPADCAARGRGGPDVGRSGGVAHVRRHPQRDGPPVPGRAEPPRAADRGPRGHGDDADGARRRAGPDRRQPEHPRARCRLRPWTRPAGRGSCCAGGSPRLRRSRRCPLRPVPKEVVARYLPPALRTHLARAVEGARASRRDHRLPALQRRRRADGRQGTRRRRPRHSTRSSPRCRTRPPPTRSPSSPPTSTRTAERWCWPPGCRPPGPTTRGGWSAASAGSPTAACRSRSRWGSTGATSSSARSAWPTARRSRSWATP